MPDIVTPEPLVVVRDFAAPRALVFRAWSNAEHMRRWFGPESFTVPEAQIDLRQGGVFALCMQAPDGQRHWMRGEYLDVSPPDRLVFTAGIFDGAVTVHTTVIFADDGAGTRLTVRQAYTIHDEAFRSAIDGAPEGWRSTLDKLEREVARIQAAARRSVVHDTFSLERSYDSPPPAVFHALTDQAAKARWFEGGEGYQLIDRAMDVRPGGRERVSGRWTSGMVSTFDAIYHDVVANERLVYSYEMHLDERKISVSLATVQLHPAGTGTRLLITEQGAFLDGYDDAGSRARGTAMLLDRLGAALGG